MDHLICTRPTRSSSATGGWLGDTTFALGAENLFDRDPLPSQQRRASIGYDRQENRSDGPRRELHRRCGRSGERRLSGAPEDLRAEVMSKHSRCTRIPMGRADVGELLEFPADREPCFDQ